MEYIMTIKPGEAPVFLPITRDELTLEREQEIVGGLIEPVATTSGYDVKELPPMIMLVNEEGLIRGLRTNIAATVLTGGAFVVGPAVIVAVDEEDFRPFTVDEMRELAKGTRRILGVAHIKGEDGGGDSED